MKLYEPHPLALIFPEMNDAAIDAMAADIKAHGLQNPIVLYQDKVLDGLQRQEACKRVGVPPLYLQFILLPRSIVEAGPEAFVISANLHRRHLKPEKYKALVRKLVPLVEKQLKEQATNEGAVTNDTAPTNPKGGGVSGKPGIKKKAVQKVAKMTGHSERTVYRVLKNGAKHISATLPKRKKEADADDPSEIEGQPISQVPTGKQHTKRWDVSEWAIECRLATAHVKLARAGLADAREVAALKAKIKAKAKEKEDRR